MQDVTKKYLNPLIIAVIPALNEAQNLKKLIPLLCQQLAQLSTNYDILIIDDGSTDNTYEIIVAMTKNFPLRIIQFTRNFGKENAITAGLEHAHGDVVILLDADFQHPLEIIAKFYDYWQQGYDMVYAISSNHEYSFFRKICSKWFYSFMQSNSSVKFEPHAGDFRLIDKQVVNAICQLTERNRFMKGLYSWVGYKSLGLHVTMEPRNFGVSKYSYRKLMSLAAVGITSFSAFPLRLWGIIGSIISLSSITFGCYILIKTLLYGNDTPGWATMIVSITLLCGLQLLSIGVLGEYISRIFTEVKSRPSYLIKNKSNYERKNN